jgi:hypothetical protein
MKKGAKPKAAPFSPINYLPFAELERNPKSQPSSGSEVQPQGELNDARIMARIEDQTKGAVGVLGRTDSIAEASVRVASSCAVENVEHVRAELE